MVNFYSLRKQAIQDIDNMLNNSVAVELIVYKISMKYGFGKRMVQDRYEQIAAVKALTSDNSVKKE